MGLLRYTASADNTIVSAYQLNLSTRGTGANAGAADVLETFSVYGRITTSSQELSRILLKFPTTQISADRTAGSLPASGSVSFYLRAFNAPHSRTVPIEYKLAVSAVSQSWQEGIGLDLEDYADKNNGNIGSDWIQASKGNNWAGFDGTASPGGTYSTASGETFTQHFSGGLEDLEVDVTSLVERWLGATSTLGGNYGVGIMLSASYEASGSKGSRAEDSNVIYNPDGATNSYNTKRFFGRGSQFYFKRPVIEARWDSSIRDDRANVYFSSSRAPAADNLNTIYFYNMVRGRLVNLPNVGTGNVAVSLYSGSADDSGPSGSAVFLNNASTPVVTITGSYVSKGIYSCSVCFTKSENLDTLYDIWFYPEAKVAEASGSTKQFFTGTLKPVNYSAGVSQLEPTYYLNMSNLKNGYSHNERARLNLYVREKNWKPNVYTVADADIIQSIGIRSASYSVLRLIDNQVVVAHGTGSDFHTGLSYNVSGNYFDFDMGLLEPGYAYAFRYAFYNDRLNSWVHQDKTFKFWVEES